MNGKLGGKGREGEGGLLLRGGKGRGRGGRRGRGRGKGTEGEGREGEERVKAPPDVMSGYAYAS